MKIKPPFYLLFLILCLCFSHSCLIAQEIPATKYLSLSNEALAAARYRKAISLSQEFLDNNINSNICTSEVLVAHFSNLRIAYSALGKDKEFENYCQLLFSEINPSRGSTLVRAFFLISLECKGDYDATASKRHEFTYFGDNSAGLEFFDNNLSRLPNDLIDSNPALEAWIPILRSDLLAYGGDFVAAHKEIDKASEILNSNFDKNSPETLIADLAREILAAQEGNWKEAIKLALNNKKNIEKFGNQYKELYALNSRLLQYYYNIQDYESATRIAKEGIVRPSVFDVTPTLINYRSFQGPMLPNSPSSLFAGMNYNLACLTGALSLFATGDLEVATKNANKVIYNLQKDIATNYSNFAFNRASASDKGKVDLLVQTAPTLALMNPKDSLLQSLAFDASLVYKQLSISSGNLYRNITQKLGNEAFSKRYQELEESRKLLDIATPTQADSLIQRIAQLESYLQRNLNNRFNISPSSLPKWTDVKQALNPGEAAVEFSIASTPSGDKYIASLITSESDYPEVFELCAVEDFDNLNDHFKSSDTYRLLWQPLIGNLQGISSIYFSPIGNLNILPIEYVPVDDANMLNDKFSLYRLSTTRELAWRKEQKTPREILLYGGIKYNLDDEEKSANEKDAERASDNFFGESFDFEEMSSSYLRSSVAYLPATLDEIHNIGEIFTNSGGKAQMLEGALATETSIKQLDGTSVPVLHVATHGFTVPKKSRTRLGRFLAKHDDRSTFEEQSLGRSGLMFAGAANTINAKDNFSISSFDDGILTGREISRLDLSGINTVVLSACESGLGEIGNEGVVGLQRGLKRAGVQTLIMSLWKVDDEATSMLMSEFYRNLMNGISVTNAMRESQKYLRAYDNGRFDDPQFWASFIILDAI